MNKHTRGVRYTLHWVGIGISEGFPIWREVGDNLVGVSRAREHTHVMLAIVYCLLLFFVFDSFCTGGHTS